MFAIEGKDVLLVAHDSHLALLVVFAEAALEHRELGLTERKLEQMPLIDQFDTTCVLRVLSICTKCNKCSVGCVVLTFCCGGVDRGLAGRLIFAGCLKLVEQFKFGR